MNLFLMCAQTFDFLRQKTFIQKPYQKQKKKNHFFVARIEKCTTFAPRKTAG